FFAAQLYFCRHSARGEGYVAAAHDVDDIQPPAAFGTGIGQVGAQLVAASPLRRHGYHYVAPLHASRKVGGFAAVADDVCHELAPDEPAVERIVFGYAAG